MVLVLHGSVASPPVCAVRLVCSALGLEYDFRIVNVAQGQNRTPEFLKMNPQHSLPTIQDDDFILWDSHAIAAYLATKAESGSWYPKDLRLRAVVNQRLHFDNTILFARLHDLMSSIFAPGRNPLPAYKIERLQEAVELLGELIQDGGWLTGDRPTIADCCAAANAFPIVTILPTINVPPKVDAWLWRCEDFLPGFDAVMEPALSRTIKLLQSKVVGIAGPRRRQREVPLIEEIVP